MVDEVRQELKKYASAERKETNEWFFKTGKGEYGEGDVFIGVRVPDIRKVAKQFLDVDLKTLKKLLYSKIHEERLLAILILVEQYKKNISSGSTTGNPVVEPLEIIRRKKHQKKIARFYLQHRKQVNNWDLVDLSAHHILGQAILDKLENKKILDKLTDSSVMWDRRIGIIASWAFIRQGDIKITLRLAKKLLGDKEDLMHKAVGWMLRESWKLGENKPVRRVSQSKINNATKREINKKAQRQVEEFLIKNYNQISRTTLRYAIERMPETKRQRFLKGNF